MVVLAPLVLSNPAVRRDYAVGPGRGETRRRAPPQGSVVSGRMTAVGVGLHHPQIEKGPAPCIVCVGELYLRAVLEEGR